MMMLISYDISTMDKAGEKRLRDIAKLLLDYGQRVQASVYECEITPTQWVTLKNKLLVMYHSEEDSLRFYALGSNWHRRVEHYGIKPSINFNDPLIL